MRVAARIRRPLFWRFVYWVLARRVTVVVVRRGLEALERRGLLTSATVLDQLAAYVTRLGWPVGSGGAGWVNLDVSRFTARVRHGVPARVSRKEARGSGLSSSRLQVGVVGRFSGLLTFTREHFESVPDDIEFHLFDLEHRGHYGDYLETAAPHYHAFALDGVKLGTAAQKVADAINHSPLDLLLIVERGPFVYELADLVTTPCVAHICTGSDLLYHEAIDFNVYCQPEADYFVRDDRLFCGTSRASFGDERAYEGFLLYDSNGLEGVGVQPWRDREPLIVFHGSLYKLAAPDFLATILRLVGEHDSVEFVYVGADRDGARERIDAAARRFGVASRVSYEGEFSRVRVGEGGIEGEGKWLEVRALLARARLAPDPWPVGGGSARVEAYLLGVPTVHMRVRFDEAHWGRPQHALVELPSLLIPEGSAVTPAEYRRLCERCLTDGEFAEGLVENQLAVAARVVSPEAYWRQVVELYERWRVGAVARVTR